MAKDKSVTIKGEIVHIMDKNDMAVNKGSDHGVENGMVFAVYEEGPMIKDEAGNDLELLEFVKARVEVFHVQKEISCVKFVAERGSSFGWDLVRRPSARPPGVVKVGDLVRSVESDLSSSPAAPYPRKSRSLMQGSLEGMFQGYIDEGRRRFTLFVLARPRIVYVFTNVDFAVENSPPVVVGDDCIRFPCAERFSTNTVLQAGIPYSAIESVFLIDTDKTMDAGLLAWLKAKGYVARYATQEGHNWFNPGKDCYEVDDWLWQERREKEKRKKQEQEQEQE